MTSHDLVADFLLSHHQDFIAGIKNKTSLRFFTQVYKDTNKCGRAHEDFKALYGLLFASVAAREASEADAAVKALTNPPPNASAVTPVLEPSPIVERNLFSYPPTIPQSAPSLTSPRTSPLKEWLSYQRAPKRSSLMALSMSSRNPLDLTPLTLLLT